MNLAKQPLIDLSKPILVSMESFTDLKDMKVISDDGYTIQTTLQEMDQTSRNNVHYPADDLRKSLDTSRRVQDHIANKVWWGEAEHPTPDGVDEKGMPTGTPTLHRLLRVEPSRYSHKIDSFWYEGNMIKGIVVFGGAFGKMYRDDIVRTGANYAFSLRAYTPNYIKKTDSVGNPYTIKKFPIHVVTYDLVTGPGHERARMVDPDVFRNSKGSNPISLESCKYYEFTNVYDEIKDIFKNKSQESLDIISELYGVDVQNARVIIKDANTANVKVNGGSLNIPLNSMLVNEIIGR